MAVLEELRCKEPSEPRELIGDGNNGPIKTARALWRGVDDILVGNDDEPLLAVITGPPGVGKTTIANMIATKITGSRFAVTTENGKEIGVSRVREAKMSMHDSCLFSTTGHRAWIINEGDKITDDGQVAFLSLLDECPRRFHVIITSNEDISDWSERFETRFEVYNITKPLPLEIAEGLTTRLGVQANVATAAAEQCGGNVRQAIKEIKAWKRKNGLT